MICRVLTDFPVRRDYKDVTDRGQVSKTSVPVWVLSTCSERNEPRDGYLLAGRRCRGRAKQLVVAGNHLLGWAVGVQVAVIKQQDTVAKRLNQTHIM